VPPTARKGGRLALPVGRGPLLPGHRAYLATRGLDADKIVHLWGVEGLGQTARFRWRLFIPIHYHGEVVSWTTRSIRPDDKLRYISAGAEEEAVSHKSVLYGADYARHAVIIHEGPIDVWATGPGAVATFGTAYTTVQLEAMSRFAVRVVCFDAEPMAQARARELADALSVYQGSTYNIQLETGKDVAEAHPDEVAELRKVFLE